MFGKHIRNRLPTSKWYMHCLFALHEKVWKYDFKLTTESREVGGTNRLLQNEEEYGEPLQYGLPERYRSAK